MKLSTKESAKCPKCGGIYFGSNDGVFYCHNTKSGLPCSMTEHEWEAFQRGEGYPKRDRKPCGWRGSESECSKPSNAVQTLDDAEHPFAAWRRTVRYFIISIAQGCVSVAYMRFETTFATHPKYRNNPAGLRYRAATLRYRGIAELIALKLLSSHGEMYGLDMIAKSPLLKRGTVYVTLDRLEDGGFISSREVASPSGSRGSSRRAYAITESGRRALCGRLDAERLTFNELAQKAAFA